MVCGDSSWSEEAGACAFGWLAVHAGVCSRSRSHDQPVLSHRLDGAEGAAGLSILFPPAFFQTVWFMLLCVIAASGVLWLLFALRLRQLTRQLQARLAVQLAERERIARELHDALLQSMGGLILRFQTATERIPQMTLRVRCWKKHLSNPMRCWPKGGNGFLSYESFPPRPTNCPKLLLRWAWSLGKIIRRIFAWW
jgi:hypothetical protein